MGPRGRMKWVPKVVIEELESIKCDDQVESDAEAFHKLVKYSRRSRSTIFRRSL